MQTLTWGEAHQIQEWILAVLVIAATGVFATGTRALMRKIPASSRRKELLEGLAPQASHLINVVGLRIAADVAPLAPKLKEWMENGIYVLVVLIVLNLIRRVAMIGLIWTSERSNQSHTLQQGFIPLLRNLVTLFVFFSGSIMILKHFDYDVMSLITALGVTSLAVGLAAKDTLSNMISGFTLIIDRNLSPGDRIDLAGAVGDVEEIGLRSTRIRIADGNTLIVPNSELVNTKILNLSLPTREVSCTTTFRVPTTVAFPKMREICNSVLDEVEKTPTKRRWVHLSGLGDGMQAITVGFWVSDLDEKGEALSNFHEKLLARLKQEGIPLTQSAAQPAG